MARITPSTNKTPGTTRRKPSKNDKLIGAFVQYSRAAGHRPNTIRMRVCLMRRFSVTLQDRPLTAATPDDVYAFGLYDSGPPSPTHQVLVYHWDGAAWCRTDGPMPGSYENEIYAATVAPGFRREALIDVFDPPRRLRLIYLVPEGLPAFDGAVVEDILLEPQDNATVLRLLCSGVPDNADWMVHFQKLRAASERVLGRLRMLCEQRERAVRASGAVAT